MGNSWSNQNNGTSNRSIPSGTLGPRPPQNAAQRTEINPRALFSNSEFSWNVGENVFESLSPYSSNIAQLPPPSVVHERTVRNVVRLSKNSLQLFPGSASKCYILQFQFDTLVDCGITTYFFAKELQEKRLLSFCSKYCSKPSVQYFRAGLGQTYRQQESEGVDLSKVSMESLIYRQTDEYPVIVKIENTQSSVENSESLELQNTKCSNNSADGEIMAYYIYLSLDEKEKSSSAALPLKVIKQKILVNGVVYELEEIYGIDSGSTVTQGCLSNSSYADEGANCAICLSQPRDTALLPCRHMCLCSECAQRLRFQSNSCPICRQSVQSFLQVKGLRSQTNN
ncbi:hypothetical protein GAYE_SCF04G2463 [Galdieria yellowstonensis]|uniref:RING-type E3 ubiquitin transferase n=1 Tax=Galdieria yellowstonensis TaxID=3028027 RepID=A0AAV9IB10_9RHOD|nr:hypothetical protein GAYE_SCF04G2463 [Galdieria yellowstonensis]